MAEPKKQTEAEQVAAAAAANDKVIADAKLREELKAELKAEADAEAEERNRILNEEAQADVSAMTGDGVELASGGSMLVRIVKADKKTAKGCPKGRVAMRALGTRRICCESGAVYLFHDDGVEYVAKADRNECAAQGAAEVAK